MIDPRACKREYIKIGSHILFSINKDDPEEFWRIGIIESIITPKNCNFEELGIKIRVVDGSIGYTKRIFGDDELTNEIILNLIKGGETDVVEFKETFKVDSENKRELKCLRDASVKEIAAFMNTSGGILLIGIDDLKNITGLELDYSFTTVDRKNQTKEDKFKQEIRSYVKEKLADPKLESFYKIMIKQIDGKEICIIKVSPSEIPVFVNQKVNYTKCGDSNQKSTMRQIFYFRTDSGVIELDNRKLLEFWNKKNNSS